MRIAFVGNRRNLDRDGKSFNTEAHIAATLEELGNEVKFIQENEIQPGQLVDLVKDCNLFFWVRTWEGFVTRDDLKAIHALGILSVNFHLDAFIGLARANSLDTDPRWRCDFVFTADGDPRSAETFKSKGINHYFLWPGVFEPEAYLLDLPRKEHEIIFVGSWLGYHREWPYRERLVRWLMQNYGSRFEIWGPQGKGLVRGAELNRLYAGTAIAIGDTLCKDFKHERYVSDRLMESCGRGAFIIHPYVKGIEECFELGKELVTYEYGNFQQLADLIQYYYSHDDERENIRRAGHERVKKDHTYSNRMRQLLAVLRQEGVIE